MEHRRPEPASSEGGQTSLEDAVLARLGQVFARLDAAGIPFCVARNRDRIPAALVTGSDVDVVVPSEIAAADLLALLADFDPVQISPHRSTLEVYFRVDAIHLHVDFLIGDREWRGARYLENREILAEAWDDDGIPVASELHQAFYAWFSSLTQRRVFKRRYAPLVANAVRNSPTAFEALLQRTFGEPLGRELLWLARGGNPERSEALAGRCRRAVWQRAVRRRPIQTMAGLVRHYLPEIRQYLRPDGMTVAILGPDGAGKSSVCSVIADEARGSLPFKRVEVQHLYKRVLPQLYQMRRGRLRPPAAKVVPTSDPHGKSLHSPLLSAARMGYFAIDQWLSQIICERPKLARNVLVLHDRHLLELTVDPKRFRFGGPPWLARLAAWAAPQPDLVILLDAPPAVLRARKQEVPAAETARQRAAYRELVAALPGGRIVDAARPPEEVAAAVRAAIVEHLAERTARRFDLEPPRSRPATYPVMLPVPEQVSDPRIVSATYGGSVDG